MQGRTVGTVRTVAAERLCTSSPPVLLSCSCVFVKGTYVESFSIPSARDDPLCLVAAVRLYVSPLPPYAVGARLAMKNHGCSSRYCT